MSDDRELKRVAGLEHIEITRGEVQEWVDSLTDRQAAYLQWIGERTAYRAEIDAIREASEACGSKARELAKAGKVARSKGARDCVAMLGAHRVKLLDRAIEEGVE